LSQSEDSITNSTSQSTSISSHSEVSESISELNSNTNNSKSINSITNPRPAEYVREQTNVSITPEKQPAESTEQQVSAKRHHVRMNNRRRLPQTGASTNSSSLLGLIATAVGGLLGLRRKKNRNRRR
ncbi:MAG: LPXTG cell wall anchor domain-containing protein, partial [Lactobacillus sp.]|uniref:LPXTG cell wall anchor domain-containing protein n=1 Tax=Lactobacillus sp. TaxID=1591 RepID=UPI0023CA32F6